MSYYQAAKAAVSELGKKVTYFKDAELEKHLRGEDAKPEVMVHTELLILADDAATMSRDEVEELETLAEMSGCNFFPQSGGGILVLLREK